MNFLYKKLYKFYTYHKKKFLQQCDWIRVFSKSTVSKIIEEYQINSKQVFSLPEGSYVKYYENKINPKLAREILKLNKFKFSCTCSG